MPQDNRVQLAAKMLLKQELQNLYRIADSGSTDSSTLESLRKQSTLIAQLIGKYNISPAVYRKEVIDVFDVLMRKNKPASALQLAEIFDI